MENEILCGEMEEITLFDPDGNPTAYISPDDDNTIYLWSGKPVAYLNEENIYGFNGKHLGWFKDGTIWDHDGKRVGFVKRALPVFPKFEPFKSFKQFKPFRAFRQSSPCEPFKSTCFATTTLAIFLSMGNI